RVLGQPAVVEGTTILLGEHWLEVARACSGLRMFYSIVAVAAALAIVTKPRKWLIISLFVLIAPIAVTVNVARVLGTGFLKIYLPEDAFATGHDLAGLLM